MYARITALLALLGAQALATPLVAAESTSDAPLVIERLECRGNSITSCTYILSHLYLSTGLKLDEEEIRNAKYRLSALPNFTSVRIFLEKGSERGKANLIVEVVEANPLFAEALAGVANHDAHAVGLRIGHQNLSGSGERLEFTATARIPVDGPLERESAYARLQYIEPTLLGTERYFFSASAVHFDNRFESRFGDVKETRETGIDFLVGRRLADFSYLALGYRYLFDGSFGSRLVRRDGFVEIEENEYSHQLLIDYGWNSEDDPYFPTQGGRLRASLALALTDAHYSNDSDGEPEQVLFGRLAFGYRHTWSFARRNYLRLKIGATPGTESRNSLEEDDGFALAYERALPTSEAFAGIERGRWYLEAKHMSFGVSGGNNVEEFGLKAGLRLDTRRFGIVELYVLGTKER